MRNQNRTFVFVKSCGLFLALQAILFCCICISCASSPKNFSRNVCGIVTDTNDAPVQGFEISIDGKYAATTNAQGLFVLQALDGKEHLFVAEKKGWEKIILNGKDFLSSEVICFRARTLQELLVDIEKNIERGNCKVAGDLLEKVSSVDSRCEKILLLESLVSYRCGNFSQALNWLEEVKVMYWNELLEKYESLLKEKMDLES